MGHNDGANNAHSLEQLLSPASRAVGQKNAFQDLHLPWPHHHVLGIGEKEHCDLPPTTTAGHCQWGCTTGVPCQRPAGKGVSPAPLFTS